MEEREATPLIASSPNLNTKFAVFPNIKSGQLAQTDEETSTAKAIEKRKSEMNFKNRKEEH